MKLFTLIALCFFLISCSQGQKRIQPVYTLTANFPAEQVLGYRLIDAGVYSEEEKAIALSPESSFGFTLEIELNFLL